MRYLFLFFLSMTAFIFANDPVCHKCQVIREYNEAHPENNYEYYDDFLKEQKKKEVQKIDDKEKKYACDKCKNILISCEKCKGRGKEKDVV